MAGDDHLDLDERALPRSRRDARRILFGGVPGGIAAFVTTGIGAAVGAAATPKHPSGVKLATLTIAGGVAGLLLLALATLLVLLAITIIRQRGEARSVVREYRLRATEYVIEPVSVELVSNDQNIDIVVQIRNAGRTASFTLVVVDVKGALEPFGPPCQGVTWSNHTTVEEIPRDEHRVAVIGALISGKFPEDRTSVHLTTAAGFAANWFKLAPDRNLEIRLRVSLRATTDASYSHDFGVRIGPDQALRVGTALVAWPEGPPPVE